MNAPLYISSRVINTIKSLPQTDRIAITSALAGEFILGGNVDNSDLTPMQYLAYNIIRMYVKRDAERNSPK